MRENRVSSLSLWRLDHGRHATPPDATNLDPAMPITAALSADPGVAGPLGTLAMSQVTPHAPSWALRARAWQRELDRIGVTLPFALIHDIGLLFSAPAEQRTLGPRCDFAALISRTPGATELLGAYREIIDSISESEAARRAQELRATDAMIAALLARVLGTVAQRTLTKRPYPIALPADAAPYELTDLDLTALWARQQDRRFEFDALSTLARARLFVLTLVDALDVETLRLLGMLGDPSSQALSQIDLLSALSTPGAHDIVSFSLELMPSVLETKTRPAASQYAAFGYAGIGRRGSLDSLVLTELAWDKDEFARRVLDDEVLYYTRDQATEERKRQHILLIDASASMRGDRATFARGLALATAKKLLLSGDEVVFRFFDARLYEPTRSRAREVPTSHVLAFKGERGRNPVRVFSTLANELALTRAREHRDLVVHLFTHGAHDIPRPVLAAVREQAKISAVFIAPRGGALELDYLDLLDAHWLVTHETVSDKTVRTETARNILSGTASATPRAPGPRKPAKGTDAEALRDRRR